MSIEFQTPAKDADAVAWWQAVVAAGGTVSGVQLRYVSALIRALKACGAWALTDDYALYAAENSTQALVTLKKRITQTLAHVTSTNPTFVANRGFLGNSDGYVDTGWNPGSGTWQYVQNSARYGCWVYSDPGVASTKSLMGNDTVGDGQMQFGAGGNVVAGINGSSSVLWTPSARTGLIVVERTGASVSAAYQNGASQVTGTPASSAVANRDFYVLAADPSGSGPPINSGVSCAVIGAPLTNAAMYLAEYAAFRNYMTAVGVP